MLRLLELYLWIMGTVLVLTAIITQLPIRPRSIIARDTIPARYVVCTAYIGGFLCCILSHLK